LASDKPTGIQQVVAAAFERRRKVINRRGPVRIRQYKGEELEVWYKNAKNGATAEILLWVMPEWKAILEVRSLIRRQFGKKLFSRELDLAKLAGLKKQALELAAVGEMAQRLVATFESSMACLVVSKDEEEQVSRLTAEWQEFAG
jgi:hypothetical protein